MSKRSHPIVIDCIGLSSIESSAGSAYHALIIYMDTCAF